MDELVQLENWCYKVEMGCGLDAWRLTGNVYNHPNHNDGDMIFVSTPKSLDKELRMLITASGRKYKLGVCSGNEEEQFQHIQDDINRGGTSYF